MDVQESFQTIAIERAPGYVTLWLNRPEVHNAIDARMIQELRQAVALLKDEPLHALVLRGRGRSFCAGADLTWLQGARTMEARESYDDSLQLALCLRELHAFPVPVVSVAHGAVYGGGIGLLAVADIALCTKETKFCFSEVSLGLVPAVISPYILARCGESRSRAWMLAANRFTGEAAALSGLVDQAEDSAALETAVQNWVQHLTGNSRQAMMATKKLIGEQRPRITDAILRMTTDAITQARLSDDGQEGISAFLEKRKPHWK